MTDRPKPQPSPAPSNVPAPGSLPKLPQDAFNFEKRGGEVPGAKRSP